MIVIWGYGILGVSLYRKLIDENCEEQIYFADNNPSIHNQYTNDKKVFSVQSLVEFRDTNKDVDIKIYIASTAWKVIADELTQKGFIISGYYIDGKLNDYSKIGWAKIKDKKIVKLYAGDICDDVHYSDENLIGLSINRENDKHILHDITYKYPISDSSIDAYQAEDVLEHIEYDKIKDVINEIYRVLKSGGVFRLCLPDYYSSYLKNIALTDVNGNILFDPTGGGRYESGSVKKGGHVWFPNIDNVKKILEDTKFVEIEYLCYHEKDGTLRKSHIDFNNGYVGRLDNCEKDSDVYSIVIDCIK